MHRHTHGLTLAVWLGSAALCACADDPPSKEQTLLIDAGAKDSSTPSALDSGCGAPCDAAVALDAASEHDAASQRDGEVEHDAAEPMDAASSIDASETDASETDATSEDAASEDAAAEDGSQHVPDDAGGSPECAETLAISVAGGAGYDRAHDVAVDGSGAAYITGLFSGTAHFGTTTLTAAGDTDVFVAKLTAAGGFAWARRAGGLGADEGHSVAALEDGSLYVTGHFTGEAAFESEEVSGGDAGASLFIARYDTAGSLIWVRAASATVSCAGQSAAALPDGSVYVTGAFRGTCSFGTTMLTSAGASDVFLARYAADGDLTWAVRAGGDDFDIARGVAVRPDGTAFITGEFRVGAQFGAETLVANIASYDLFIAKVSSDGDFLWAEQAGGVLSSAYAYGSDIALDTEGRAYVTGRYGGTVRFGALALMGGEAPFVAKYDDNGTTLWATRLETGSGIAVAIEGDAVYAAGGVHLGASRSAGFFLHTLDDETGSVDRWRWSTASGPSIPFSYGRGIAANARCSAYVTGSFTQTWMFGGQTFSSTGDEDIFVARFLQPAP